MECPECQRLGLKSIVRHAVETSTAIPVDRYWDLNGRLHIHDPNGYGREFDCSLGHAFGFFGVRACPSCDYGGKPPDVWITRDGSCRSLPREQAHEFLCANNLP
jgi:hypothetical protein